MLVLTPAERRGAFVLVLLLAVGAGHDLWRAWHPRFLRLEDPGSGPGTTLGNEGRGAGHVSHADTAARGPSSVSVDRAPAAGGQSAILVDVNQAGVTELDALPGVGPVLAGRIVAHRQRHGRYRRLEDLLAVRGIGPRLLERLGPHVSFGPESR